MDKIVKPLYLAVVSGYITREATIFAQEKTARDDTPERLLRYQQKCCNLLSITAP